VNYTRTTTTTTTTTSNTLQQQHLPLQYTTTTARTKTTTPTTTTITTTTTATTLQLQLRLQLQHYNFNSINYTTTTATITLHFATPHYILQLWVRWPLQPLRKSQPPFGPSVDSLCHPCITTTHLSYSFLSLKTSATSLCGTIGTLPTWPMKIGWNLALYRTYWWLWWLSLLPRNLHRLPRFGAPGCRIPIGTPAGGSVAQNWTSATPKIASQLPHVIIWLNNNPLTLNRPPLMINTRRSF